MGMLHLAKFTVYRKLKIVIHRWTWTIFNTPGHGKWIYGTASIGAIHRDLLVHLASLIFGSALQCSRNILSVKKVCIFIYRSFSFSLISFYKWPWNICYLQVSFCCLFNFQRFLPAIAHLVFANIHYCILSFKFTDCLTTPCFCFIGRIFLWSFYEIKVTERQFNFGRKKNKHKNRSKNIHDYIWNYHHMFITNYNYRNRISHQNLMKVRVR